MREPARTAVAAQLVAPFAAGDLTVETARGTVGFPVLAEGDHLTGTVRALDDAGIGVSDLALRRSSLDDVFLALTGRSVAAAGPGRVDGSATDLEVPRW